MTAIEQNNLNKAKSWIVSQIQGKDAVSPWDLRQDAPAELRAGVQMALVDLISSGRVSLQLNQKISLPRVHRGAKK
jgi:hypothetical protein